MNNEEWIDLIAFSLEQSLEHDKEDYLELTVNKGDDNE